MIETIIEVLIIAGTLVCASLQMRKDALKARRVYAIAFVLMIAVCIALALHRAQLPQEYSILHCPFLLLRYYLSLQLSTGFP